MTIGAHDSIPHACPVEGEVEITVALLRAYYGRCPLCSEDLSALLRRRRQPSDYAGVEDALERLGRDWVTEDPSPNTDH